MYKKIWGLKQLEKLGFPVPQYRVIDITKDKPLELREYLSERIEKVKIPNDVGNAIGVTIRVSMPGDLDKLARHGELHVTMMNEVLKGILEKYQQYGPRSIIIVQHTIDARCSGTILKENDSSIIEAIFGDAPPLLEGYVTNYERWVFSPVFGGWNKERGYIESNEERPVLTQVDLQKLEKYLKLLPRNVYLEWSISKSGKQYFYEYCRLK